MFVSLSALVWAALAVAGGEHPNAPVPAWMSQAASRIPFLARGEPAPLFRSASVGEVTAHSRVPASFSILLNLGLDGSQRMVISSEHEQRAGSRENRCGPNHLWDPFAEVCRRLYCSADFVLVDFNCVYRHDTDQQTASVRTDNATTPSILGPTDTDAKSVKLTLDLSVTTRDWRTLQETGNLEQEVGRSLARRFGIREGRIQGVSVRGEEEEAGRVHLVAEMTLMEPEANDTSDEPSVDSVVFALTHAVSEGESPSDTMLTIGDVDARVLRIHETVDTLTSWCVPELGGRKIEYWNDEFTLILNEHPPTTDDDWVRELYINATGKTYQKGQFAANILFQSGWFGSEHRVNASGVVFVCEMNKLDASCGRIELDKSEYNVLPNGSLQFLGSPALADAVDLSEFEISDNGTILVCYKGVVEAAGLALDATQGYVSLVLLCVSVACLVAVLATYALFRQLRTVAGYNVVNLTATILAMQLTFLVGQRPGVGSLQCRLAAIGLHYEILATFFWMNVMAFDLFRTFGRPTRKKRALLARYLLYAYLVPAAIVALAYVADRVHLPVSPRYGSDDVCWITRTEAVLLFFAAPLAAILAVNGVFYGLTVASVRRVQRELGKLGEGQSNAAGGNEAAVYARMATVVGFTWTAFFAAAFLKHVRVLGDVLTYLFLVLNTLQGLFIFVAFVCNRRVFAMYAQMVRRCPACSRLRAWCSCAVKGIGRTVSTDTAISIVSSGTR